MSSIANIEEKATIADPNDCASDTELAQREAALAAVQSRCRPMQSPGADGTYETEDCEECGLPIGAERLRVAIMNLYCVHCAGALERRKKLWA